MGSLLKDLRFSLRQVRRSPGFAITAVLTLALGVGVNTAIFSLLDQALLRLLPVRDPRQLVILSGTGDAWAGHSSDHGAGVERSFSYPMYRDLQEHATVFDGLIATAPASAAIARKDTSETVAAELVSGNYFEVLGVRSAAGRVFSQEDDTKPGANPVVVASYNYWKTRLGGDSGVVGQTFAVNGHPYELIGVAAPGFQSAAWGETPDIFVPMSMLDQIIPGRGRRLQDHTDRWMNVMGRLKTGVTREQGQIALAPLWHSLRAEELRALGKKSPRFEDEYLNRSKLELLPGGAGLSYQRNSLEKPLLAVMGMAVLVLLIASINVASLLLVRAATRTREFSLRYALGASSSRIVRQLLLEGLLIGVAGGGAGLAIAPAVTRTLLERLYPGQRMTAFSASLDGRLLAFNFGVAIFVSVLFSLAPAITLLKPDIVSSLRQQAATATGGALRFRRVIVSLQVGLSVLLLVCSGLFVRTMQNLRQVNPGFNTSHLVLFHIDPLAAGHTQDQMPVLHKQLFEAMGSLPGVEGVAATNDAELADTGHTVDVTVEGYTPQPDESFPVEQPWVSASFFKTMQMELLAGRTFEESDDEHHPLVAVVNESFVWHYFSSVQKAVGKRVAFSGGTNPQLTIVGVLRDARHRTLRELPGPAFFTPLRQEKGANQLYFYLRTRLAPQEMFAQVRQAVRNIDRGLAIDNMKTMDDQIDETLANERMIELLAIAFGLLATLLAGVGLYGVLAYTTAQRTREIGIRMALGASRLGVSRLVIGDVLRLAATGVMVAIPCSVLLARLLRNQLYGVSNTDPTTMFVVVGLIAVVAVCAAFVPARRASSVDPTTALRTD